MEKWMHSNTRKSLLIQGARQTGKTYSIHEFAVTHYPENKIIEMNFILNQDMNSFFEGDLSPESILRRIQADYRFRHIDFNNDVNRPYLIFLDEIQECENAVISLKGFTMQKELYHVIASGSLLGVALKRQFTGSYPVGYVQHMNMYPMDFEEFLWAMGYEEPFLSSVMEQDHLSSATHEVLMDLFRRYIVIGGLPEAVQTFAMTNDYSEVYAVQQDLQFGYIQDIRKYGDTSTQKLKIEKCFQSVPLHLKEQNKKFMYKRVEKNGRKRMFEDALDWLYEAGLVIYCDNLKTIQPPLESYTEEENFKLFMFDTGILMSMFPESKRYSVLQGSEDIDIGGIYENAVACILAKSVGRKHLCYMKLNQQLDLDFIYEENDETVILEMISGNSLKSSSLHNFIRNHPGYKGKIIKLSGKIASDEGSVRNVPFYRFALMHCR